MENAFKRGLFHILVGSSIFIAALFISRTLFLISLSALTIIGLIFEFVRLKSSRVNDSFYQYFRPVLRDEEVSHLTGASYMFISSLILFAFFRKDIALLALAFLIIGDSVSAIVDKYIGKKKYFYRTHEGNAACLIVCFLIVSTFYLVGFDINLPVMIIGAVVACIAAAVPLPINDNITIPLLSALAMLIAEIIFCIIV